MAIRACVCVCVSVCVSQICISLLWGTDTCFGEQTQTLISASCGTCFARRHRWAWALGLLLVALGLSLNSWQMPPCKLLAAFRQLAQSYKHAPCQQPQQQTIFRKHLCAEHTPGRCAYIHCRSEVALRSVVLVLMPSHDAAARCIALPMQARMSCSTSENPSEGAFAMHGSCCVCLLHLLVVCSWPAMDEVLQHV